MRKKKSAKRTFSASSVFESYPGRTCEVCRLFIFSSQVYEEIKRTSVPGTLPSQWLRVLVEPREAPPRWEPLGGDRGRGGPSKLGTEGTHTCSRRQRAACVVPTCKSKMKKIGTWKHASQSPGRFPTSPLPGARGADAVSW